MAIPEIAGTMEYKITIQPTKTYAIDFENKRIAGTADGLGAMVQAVRKALTTPRYAERIYTGDYGSGLEGLVGKPMGYIKAKARMLMEEALAADTRIRGIRRIEVEKTGTDEATIRAHILTEYGEIYAEQDIKG